MKTTKSDRAMLRIAALDALDRIQTLRLHRAIYLRYAYGILAERGTDPGPLISGIESSAFPVHLQDQLRDNARAITAERDTAAECWRKAGARLHTFRRELDARPASAVSYKGYQSRY